MKIECLFSMMIILVGGTMNILIIGGTKFMGIHLVNSLIKLNYNVTIATRGITKDLFGNKVQRVIIERTDKASIKKALQNKHYDIVYDNQAYSSNEVMYILDNVSCDKYIQISTVSVYYPNMKLNQIEVDFDPTKYPLKYCNRNDFDYDETKRQAECAIFQLYKHIPSISVRFPLVIGEDDYTKRLYFYVEHIIKGIPMYIDNINTRLSFIMSHDAGAFLAWLANIDFSGTINATNVGSVTLADIISYIEEKSGKKAIISNTGEPASYNGFGDFSLDVAKARELGYEFNELDNGLYNSLDLLIKTVL
jgi:nucleoside-diphosphate-sugar epimerase